MFYFTLFIFFLLVSGHCYYGQVYHSSLTSRYIQIFQSVNIVWCGVVWYGVLSSVMRPPLLLSITLSILFRSFVHLTTQAPTAHIWFYYYVNSFHWTWDRNSNNNKNRTETETKLLVTPLIIWIINSIQCKIYIKLQYMFSRVFSVGK